MDAITTSGLSKTYHAHRRPFRQAHAIPALHDLTIDVREGEVFGFLGPNGAGKSTTIRLLLGFLHATAGSASVLGHDVATDGLAIRGRVGYLPGGIAFYDTMSGEDLLAYLASLYGRGAPLRRDLLDRLELSERDLRREVGEYSRGMRQKLGIIQALQHDPELAILDEPTEGLDPLMQRAFYELLEERRAAGRTVFLSSHILSEVERVCDRVAIVRRGELVELADVPELLARRRRRVELRIEGTPPDLSTVPGVSGLEVRGGTVTCQLEGDTAAFMAALRELVVRDIVIEPARLEEAFLEYYAESPTGDTAADGTAARA